MENKTGQNNISDFEESIDTIGTVNIDNVDMDTGSENPAQTDEDSENRNKKRSGKKDGVKSLIKDVIFALILAVILMQLVKPTIVQQTSMLPTLQPNDYLLLNKQAYRFSEPARGDIVVFHTNMKTETGKEKLLIKRIIALPGETVTIMDGGVYIDNELLDEPYLSDDLVTLGDVTDYTVPADEYFVMGDNRTVSNDSRQLGTIKKSDFVGKAFVRLYPFSSIKKL